EPGRRAAVGHPRGSAGGGRCGAGAHSWSIHPARADRLGARAGSRRPLQRREPPLRILALRRSGRAVEPGPVGGARPALPLRVRRRGHRPAAPARRRMTSSAWTDWLTESFFRIRVSTAAAEKLGQLAPETQQRLRQMLQDIAELADLVPPTTAQSWTAGGSPPLLQLQLGRIN